MRRYFQAALPAIALASLLLSGCGERGVEGPGVPADEGDQQQTVGGQPGATGGQTGPGTEGVETPRNGGADVVAPDAPRTGTGEE